MKIQQPLSVKKPRTLYVSDMDGTLLNRESRISETTRELLNTAISEHNALFTVATARTPATVVPLMKGVKLQLPAIVMTGAAMWDIKNSEYSNVYTIPGDKVEKIHQICNDHDVHPFVYRKDDDKLRVYHNPKLSKEEYKFLEERKHSPFKHFVLHERKSFNDAILLFSTAPYDKLQKAYQQIIKEIECTAICYRDIYNPQIGLLEVFNIHSSKATAIKTLATQVKADRVVVFGDNLNDIPMMKIATHSVAMANGLPEVREIASEVIGTNHEDSVAKWILNDLGTI